MSTMPSGWTTLGASTLVSSGQPSLLPCLNSSGVLLRYGHLLAKSKKWRMKWRMCSMTLLYQCRIRPNVPEALKGPGPLLGPLGAGQLKQREDLEKVLHTLALT